MKRFLCLCASVLLINCTPTNGYVQLPGKRLSHGLWIEKFDSDQGQITQRGRYDHGEKVGKWVTRAGGKIYQKDRTAGSVTTTTGYWPNGKIREKGHSVTEVSSGGRLWAYDGDWLYYGEDGRLRYTKRYSRGKLLDSTAAK